MQVAPLLLASWQFGSAGMLAFGAAVVIPILLHLWTRRQQHIERWAAMTFLLAAVRKSAGQVRLAQLLLLLVRIATLLLLALALADPRWADSQNRANAGLDSQLHLVLVIDSSYSMDYRTDAVSRWERAQRQAQQLVERSAEGTAFSLILMSDPPRAVIRQPAFARAEVLRELKGLHWLPRGASLAATLAEIESVVGEASAVYPKLQRRRVVIFSDLQSATWKDADSTDCRARLARLEKIAAIELVDVGEEEADNVAVSRLAIEPVRGSLPVVGASLRIQADIQSFAKTELRDHLVQVLVNGQPIADERIQLPPRGQASIAANHRVAVAGDHVVEVRLEPDRLVVDNHRWLSVPVREKVRVLCIGGRPTETRSIALALAPSKSRGDYLEVSQGPESALAGSDLGNVDCLVLCNLGRFTSEEADRVQRFVHRGGGLIVFLGDQVQAENYNRLLGPGSASGILPATLTETAATSAAGYPLDPLDYRHPIVAPFQGFANAGLLTTPVWKYVRLKPLEDATVALGLENGDPLIVEGRRGRGSCILVATAASADAVDPATDPPTPWTALASWPSFPPLAHEMLREAVSARNTARNVLVGEELSGPVASDSEAAAATLSGPDGFRQQLSLTSTGEDRHWATSGVPASGVYTAEVGDETQRFAVNVDTRESDLSRLDIRQLPSQFRQAPQREEIEPASQNSGQGTSYFRWLLAAVLALLVVEPLLGWQLGRGLA